MLHQILWQRNQDIARACLQLPFVRDLGNGSLERAAFCCYVGQDAFFLDAFLRAYALAAAKSSQRQQIKQFHLLMNGVLEELELHSHYAGRLGINLEHIEPLPAARAYTDFLLRTAWSGAVGEIIAAMTPCMRLYAWLGSELKTQLHDEHPYADWIKTYSDPAFEALAVSLDTLLDANAVDEPDIADAYRYAMLCERDFFAAPLAVV